jgi:hypothetical protein
MTLAREIETHSADVSTESYSMSLGEIISMYRDGELELHPEFQRFFRWSPEQKSRLIESLLLGIPIPPIFVAEREDSKWDVIDGLQRLSTVLEVIGELKEEDGSVRPALELTRTRYLPSLEGKSWSGNDPKTAIPEAAKVKLKRARLDVNIVKQTSDEVTKYEIFQRLNTGGSQATDQEIRNCILIMADRDFFAWIRRLGEDAHFRACVPITDRALDEAYDLELVVRFIVLATTETAALSQIAELGTFLTDQIVNRAGDKKFPKARVEKAFRNVFELLDNELQMNSFRRYDPNSKRYVGPMLISLFEIVAVGFGRRLLRGDSLPEPAALLKAHRRLWTKDKLDGFVGPGVTASRRIPKTVVFGDSWLA